MLFEKFFAAASRILPVTVGTSDLDALAGLDPAKIYVENVRSIFDVSHASAVRLCETAVRQGLLSRFVEVRCPDGTVVASASDETGLPTVVTCHEEHGGFDEEVEIGTVDLPKSTFYRLIHASSDSDA